MDRLFNQQKSLYFLLMFLMSSNVFPGVYFNTFYNAETSYNKALNIIEQSPILDEIEVPTQAKKLLSEAIENSKTVLQKYPDSKYVDDAIYIIAKSSFLRDEVAVAESYFNQLLRDYPASKFHALSKIWLTYTHLRMGMVDTARYEIESIQANTQKGGEKLYLIHNILAEIAKVDGNIENIYLNYEKAADFTPSKSKKISTYGKLVLIAEKNEDKVKASEYLVALGNLAPENIRIDARLKWITYQRELGNYDIIISEIQRMLGMTEFTTEFMQLELELGKVYKDQGNFELASEIFGMMVEKYSKKDETAEAYYQLGLMSLMENYNFDLAREYFESSKSEKSSSFYGRESKELLNKINRYETLLDLYKEAVKKPEEEIEVQNDYIKDEDNPPDEQIEDTLIFNMGSEENKTRDVNGIDIGSRLGNMDFSIQIQEHPTIPMGSSPDSILFMIGEMLLYDFNQQERSLEKLKILVNDYPKSKFASQSLYVLSYFEPDENWHYQLETNYPFSEFLNPDSIMIDTSKIYKMEIKRDYAWSLAERSYEEAYAEFRRLFDDENDTLSGYISAFICDYYLNDMERAVKHYQAFSDSFKDHSYYSQIDNRLKIIEADLEIQKAIAKQGIDYKEAVHIFHDVKDFDSTKILLDEIVQGENSHYKDAANRLKIIIREYQELSEEIYTQASPTEEDNTEQLMAMSTSDISSNKDSLIYILAELLAKELNFEDSALYYHQKLVSSYPESKFRPYSLIALQELEPNGKWGDILVKEYPDTSFAPDSTVHQIVYHSEIYQDNFQSNHEELIQVYDKYLELFPEPYDSNLFIEDTTIILEDTLGTHIVPIDSNVFIFDTTLIKSDTNLIPTDSIIDNIGNIYTDINTIKNDTDIVLLDTLMLIQDSNKTEVIFPDTSIINMNLSTNEILYEKESADSIWIEYIIQKGETLYSIAKSIFGSKKYWSLIYKWNEDRIGDNPNIISPYKVLAIKTKSTKMVPPKNEKKTYTVLKGQTLWEIASIIYNDPYAWTILVYDNHEIIIDPNNILADQKLIIRLGLKDIEK